MMIIRSFRTGVAEGQVPGQHYSNSFAHVRGVGDNRGHGWALADGVGDHPTAGRAARLAATIAAGAAATDEPGIPAARAALAKTSETPVGDTTLAVVSHNRLDEVWVEWAGAVRAYSFTAGRLTQITADHVAARRVGAVLPAASMLHRLVDVSARDGEHSSARVDDHFEALVVITRGFWESLDRVLEPAMSMSGCMDAATTAQYLADAASEVTESSTLLVIKPGVPNQVNR